MSRKVSCLLATYFFYLFPCFWSLIGEITYHRLAAVRLIGFSKRSNDEEAGRPGLPPILSIPRALFAHESLALRKLQRFVGCSTLETM